MNDPIYTVQRTLKKNTGRSDPRTELIGPVHGSDDVKITLCDQYVNPKWWWVHTNVPGMGEVTCRKCLREISRRGGSAR